MVIVPRAIGDVYRDAEEERSRRVARAGAGTLNREGCTDAIFRGRSRGRARREGFLASVRPWTWKIYLSIPGEDTKASSCVSPGDRNGNIAVLSDFCAILQMERFTLRLEWFRKNGRFFRRGRRNRVSRPAICLAQTVEFGHCLVTARERARRSIVQNLMARRSIIQRARNKMSDDP